MTIIYKPPRQRLKYYKQSIVKNNVHMGWLTFAWNPDKTGMIRTRQGDKGGVGILLNQRQGLKLIFVQWRYVLQVSSKFTPSIVFSACQVGLEKVKSSNPGQEDFLVGQVTFKAYLLPKGQRSRQVTSNKIIN